MSDILQGVEFKQNIHIRPEEALKNFQVERVIVEENTEKGYFYEFLKLPDLNGKAIWISRICDNTKRDEIGKMLVDAKALPLQERTLSPEESERYEKIKKLKLPKLFEGYILFNTKINLDEFVIPGDDVEATKFVSIHGPTGAGKSLLTAVLDNKIDAPPLTFDRFTEVGPRKYVEEINKQGLDKNDVLKIWETVRAIRGNNNVLPTTMPLSENLDEMLEFFKKGTRPKYIFIEAVTDSLGLFSTDCVFVAARDACEARIIIEPNPHGENKIEIVHYSEDPSYGELAGKKVYPPILKLQFLVGNDKNTHRISPGLAVDFVRDIEARMNELLE